ncbi:MAG: molybdate ABC transporter substrate-binding protein [Desulfobulbus sp.]
MRCTHLILFALVVLLCSALPVAQAAQEGKELRISVPASMTDAVKELITLYGASGNHPTILPNFGPSGSLAKQIQQGAPVDIFISANLKWMQFLRDEKKIDPATEQVLAGNTLVFAGRKTATTEQIHSLADIVRCKRIAIGSPASVPAGEYAMEAMRKAGIDEQLHKENKLIMAKDVRQALTYADRGEVDGAFVYKTDALMGPQTAILFTVPADMYKSVDYPIALTTQGAASAEARAFYEFLLGPEGAKVFTKYGFTVNR